MDKQKNAKGSVYFSYALLAFAGIGIELLLAFLLEPLIYGCQMNEWTTTQNILHWIITCLCWGLVAYLLVKNAKKKYGFDVFANTEKAKPLRWVIVFILLALMLIYSYYDWNGFKVAKEFLYNGWLKFIFQYLYYIFEVVLVVLIIVFGQKAFETWFHKGNETWIPYGGVLCGLTWGLGHILTKGNLVFGILLILISATYCLTYQLLNRNVKIAYWVIWLMFVL